MLENNPELRKHAKMIEQHTVEQKERVAKDMTKKGSGLKTKKDKRPVKKASKFRRDDSDTGGSDSDEVGGFW